MGKHNIKYSNEPIGEVKIIADFLPPPNELAIKEETVKVTLSMTKSSLDFFKRIAKKRHTKYQKMIRTLLDKYANHFDQKIMEQGNSKS